ncbi:nuclease-related domain-containing protein [Curtobacterium sp. VKM Ac-2922]|uniref:nuclease-related domain-containing protein n=1 Tax=Curtobacterium sp. VKM Ac-2922 TaxID=2929475 RepID=UPI001FB335E4|nr:nuclease-related domain-containing protein [Curtobacterium sp. VKM Ac-2922]MCJ1715417.1 NERD domain-containing protein [Curtobacterium sp. VKM Ac-2922]
MAITGGSARKDHVDGEARPGEGELGAKSTGFSTGALQKAGASARREHERRLANDEAAVRARWGRLGGVAVALTPERQSTSAWRSGAIGEERVGASLDALSSDVVRVLHDRRRGRSRANIDHLVVTTTGVWVIDTKRYQSERPTLRVDGGILQPRTERLFVGRRDRSSLLLGMQKQLDAVRSVVDVPVVGALCFIDADWPIIGGSFQVDGVHVVWPKKLSKLLRRAAGDVDVTAVEQRLQSEFRPA